MKIFGFEIGKHSTPKDTAPSTHPVTMINGRYLIDVRTYEEWQRDHIAGAILIPHDRIGKEIQKVIPDKHAPIALFCRSGRRSGMALDVLTSMGYDQAENWGSIQDARRKLNLP